MGTASRIAVPTAGVVDVPAVSGNRHCQIRCCKIQCLRRPTSPQTARRRRWHCQRRILRSDISRQTRANDCILPRLQERIHVRVGIEAIIGQRTASGTRRVCRVGEPHEPLQCDVVWRSRRRRHEANVSRRFQAHRRRHGRLERAQILDSCWPSASVCSCPAGSCLIRRCSTPICRFATPAIRPAPPFPVPAADYLARKGRKARRAGAASDWRPGRQNAGSSVVQLDEQRSLRYAELIRIVVATRPVLPCLYHSAYREYCASERPTSP